MRFLDRHATDLDYHARVLRSARRTDLQLLDRLRFIGFFSTLTDELFRVRVADLLARDRAGLGGGSPTGNSAADQVRDLRERFAELAVEQREVLEELLAELADEGVELAAVDELEPEARRTLRQRFMAEQFPILTPLAVGPAHPFPFISDLSLSIGVVFDLADAPPAQAQFARVKVPPSLDRLQTAGDGRFVLLEDVIGANLDLVFPDREVAGWHTFRVTRDAGFDVDADDAVEDLREAVETELEDRRFGRAVRLEVDQRTPHEVVDLLRDELALDHASVVRLDAPLGLDLVDDLAGIDRPDLRAAPIRGVTPRRLRDGEVFAELREGGELLVQHPYESFDETVLWLLEQAAEDPRVMAIKTTLYRTSSDSPVVQALRRAARLGKQVAALVELKARFDEEANIDRASELEDAGVHVVHGFVELKTHTKTALVVRRDEDGVLRRYGHVGTGNYNPTTAQFYEDLGLLTADARLTDDLADLFNMLTSQRREAFTTRLLVAPRQLRQRLVELVDEQAHADGRIVLKANNLSHPEVVEALYAASEAGADIDLVIRSVCTLVPGVDGQSGNIRVRSVVGRVLEHSRIYRFGHEPAEGAYLIGSADLMPRNLDGRVEAVVPVEHTDGRRRLDAVLEALLADTANAWEMQPDGTWEAVRPADGAQPHDAQRTIAQLVADTG